MSRFLPFAALLIAIALFFGYVNPAYTGSIAAQEAQIASADNALTAAAAYSAKENQLAAARDQISTANLDRLTTFLPDSVNNVQSILDINALAARSGLSISSIDVGADTPSAAAAQKGLPIGSGPVGSITILVNATGTYSAFHSFLVGVESSVRLLDVSTLSVKGSDTGVYSYQITLRLYWLR